MAKELGGVAGALAVGAAILGAIGGNAIARWIGAFFRGFCGGHDLPSFSTAWRFRFCLLTGRGYGTTQWCEREAVGRVSDLRR
jgi:hypothetical protein